jgi:hypothetical protein
VLRTTAGRPPTARRSRSHERQHRRTEVRFGAGDRSSTACCRQPHTATQRGITAGQTWYSSNGRNRDGAVVEADEEAKFVSRSAGNTAAVHKNAKTLPSRAVPAVELPASSDELAVKAVERLGWKGVLLPQLTLLGRKVYVVAELLPDAHAERLCFGVGPVVDRTTVATWVWPELAGKVPPAAVRIVGVLAVAKHWRTGLASAVPFALHGDAAVVLPSSVALTDDYLSNCLPRARRYGLSIVTADPDGSVSMDLAGTPEHISLEQTAVTRWVNEVVYEQVLATAS